MEHTPDRESPIDTAKASRIWELNLQLSTQVLNEAAEGIEALGLEPKEFFVLDAVEERPYPAELARHLSMAKPTITLYLRNLQAKGFLVRGIDTKDLRRHRLELTGSGLETVTQARAILTARYRERLIRLNSDEQGEFARLLAKLTGSPL